MPELGFSSGVEEDHRFVNATQNLPRDQQRRLIGNMDDAYVMPEGTPFDQVKKIFKRKVGFKGKKGLALWQRPEEELDRLEQLDFDGMARAIASLEMDINFRKNSTDEDLWIRLTPEFEEKNKETLSREFPQQYDFFLKEIEHYKAAFPMARFSLRVIKKSTKQLAHTDPLYERKPEITMICPLAAETTEVVDSKYSEGFTEKIRQIYLPTIKRHQLVSDNAHLKAIPRFDVALFNRHLIHKIIQPSPEQPRMYLIGVGAEVY